MASQNTDIASLKINTGKEMNQYFTPKVSIPKGSSLKMPCSPLRGDAPSFAPDTQTAPELPAGFTPGSTPQKPKFDLLTTTVSCLSPVGKIIGALNVCNDAAPAAANTNDKPGRDTSPNFSDSKTLIGNGNGMNATDEKTLRACIGGRATNLLLKYYPPSQQSYQTSNSIKTWEMRSKDNVEQAFKLVDRIWGGRLDHRLNAKTSIIYIDPLKKKVAAFPKTAPQPAAQPAPKPATQPRVPPPVNAVWGGFADVTSRGVYAQEDKDRAAAREQAFWAKRKAEQEANIDARRLAIQKRDTEAGVKRVECTFTSTKPKPLITNKSTADAAVSSTVSGETSVTNNTEQPKRTVLLPHQRKKAVATDSTSEIKTPITTTQVDSKETTVTEKPKRTFLLPHERKRAAPVAQPPQLQPRAQSYSPTPATKALPPHLRRKRASSN